MAAPEWLREEIARRAEQDRLDRRAAYDRWARDWLDCGQPVSGAG